MLLRTFDRTPSMGSAAAWIYFYRCALWQVNSNVNWYGSMRFVWLKGSNLHGESQRLAVGNTGVGCHYQSHGNSAFNLPRIQGQSLLRGCMLHKKEESTTLQNAAARYTRQHTAPWPHNSSVVSVHSLSVQSLQRQVAIVAMCSDYNLNHPG